MGSLLILFCQLNSSFKSRRRIIKLPEYQMVSCSMHFQLVSPPPYHSTYIVVDQLSILKLLFQLPHPLIRLLSHIAYPTLHLLYMFSAILTILSLVYLERLYTLAKKAVKTSFFKPLDSSTLSICSFNLAPIASSYSL